MYEYNSTLDQPIPDWIAELCSQVLAAPLFNHGPKTVPVRFNYWLNPDGIWEIAEYLPATETVGGRNDGDVNSAVFLLDIKVMATLLDEVFSLGWTGSSVWFQYPPHVWAHGTWHGHEVVFRVLCVPPEGAEPIREKVFAG